MTTSTVAEQATEKVKRAETQTNAIGQEKPIIVLISLYLILLSILLAYGLIQFWPPFQTADAPATDLENVAFLFWQWSISYEMRLILVVIISGALGSLVHALRSLFWYVGNQAFKANWTLMYLMLPIVGMILSLIFFFILRGGLFAPQTQIDAASPYGFAGLAALIGMFSNRAALKLQEIIDFVMKTTASMEGKDAFTPKTEG
jgi:hypothetical protein